MASFPHHGYARQPYAAHAFASPSPIERIVESKLIRRQHLEKQRASIKEKNQCGDKAGMVQSDIGSLAVVLAPPILLTNEYDRSCRAAAPKCFYYQVLIHPPSPRCANGYPAKYGCPSP
jgi:hypothetical protein